MLTENHWYWIGGLIMGASFVLGMNEIGVSIVSWFKEKKKPKYRIEVLDPDGFPMRSYHMERPYACKLMGQIERQQDW